MASLVTPPLVRGLGRTIGPSVERRLVNPGLGDTNPPKRGGALNDDGTIKAKSVNTGQVIRNAITQIVVAEATPGSVGEIVTANIVRTRGTIAEIVIYLQADLDAGAAGMVMVVQLLRDGAVDVLDPYGTAYFPCTAVVWGTSSATFGGQVTIPVTDDDETVQGLTEYAVDVTNVSGQTIDQVYLRITEFKR